jgi:hypothetical protein
MSKDRDVKDIITLLQNLQIQQATLISCLERLSEGEETRTRVDPKPQPAQLASSRLAAEYGLGIPGGYKRSEEGSSGSAQAGSQSKQRTEQR